jgi:hypothetical protein
MLGAECDAVAGSPTSETCNSIDDDCDGETDEGFDLGQPCTVGVGACQASGVTVCKPDGSGVQCGATPGIPGPELCGTGIDEDCDFFIDEGFGVGASCRVGVGACENIGVLACSADRLTSECDATPGSPTPELCNGIDDDCDEETDEGNPEGGALCTTGVGGICEDGAIECVAGTLVCRAHAANPEICDGRDNDCDGAPDNGVCGFLLEFGSLNSFAAVAGDIELYPDATLFPSVFDDGTSLLVLSGIFIPPVEASFNEIFTFQLLDPNGAPTDTIVTTVFPDGTIDSGSFNMEVTQHSESGEISSTFSFLLTTGEVSRGQCGAAGPLTTQGVPLDPLDATTSLVGNVCITQIGGLPFNKPFNVALTGTIDILGDVDLDGILDPGDNCRFVPNATQADADANGLGDDCQCGDVDGDGFTNVVDALKIARGEVLSSDPNFDKCDVNGDEFCNVADALSIARGEASSRPEDQECPGYGAPTEP